MRSFTGLLPSASGALLAILGLVKAPDGAAHAQPAAQEELLGEKASGTPEKGETDVGSSDGRRVAWAERRDRSWVVMVNGKEQGASYPAIGVIAFSPDSKRLAYAAVLKGKWLAVLDGSEQAPRLKSIDKLVFSPNSERLAYSGEDHFRTVFVDGHEDPGGYHWWGFSSDSKRFVSLGWEQVYVDGKPVLKKGIRGVGEGPFVLSPDARTFAYSPSSRYRVLASIDGTEIERYQDTGPIAFSPTGQLAYEARRGNDWVVVWDGKEGPSFKDIVSGLVFSDDGQHVAYLVLNGKKLMSIVDGRQRHELDLPAGYRKSEPYRTGGLTDLLFIGSGASSYGLTLSTDGQHEAYVVEFGRRVGATTHRVIRDGQPAKEYIANQIFDLMFSPDGRHLAYVIKDRDRMQSLVVVDDEEGRPYDQVYPKTLSFSDPASVSYVARNGRRLVRVTQPVP